jgi:hypothetical protein
MGLVGCDRTFTTEVDGVTPPELHVIVKDAQGARVQGATVSIFSSQASLEAGTNAIKTGQTDTEGKVVATASDLKNPGEFFVRAQRDGLTATAKTPYLLLTDGHTYFTLKLQ